jgi:transcriptional regulator with XRE-family HTH domain
MISSQLVAIRTQHGLSQRAVAERIGIRQQTLTDLERGGDMHLSTLLRLCEEYKVTLADLTDSTVGDITGPALGINPASGKTIRWDPYHPDSTGGHTICGSPTTVRHQFVAMTAGLFPGTIYVFTGQPRKWGGSKVAITPTEPDTDATSLHAAASTVLGNYKPGDAIVIDVDIPSTLTQGVLIPLAVTREAPWIAVTDPGPGQILASRSDVTTITPSSQANIAAILRSLQVSDVDLWDKAAVDGIIHIDRRHQPAILDLTQIHPTKP